LYYRKFRNVINSLSYLRQSTEGLCRHVSLLPTPKYTQLFFTNIAAIHPKVVVLPQQ